MRFEPLALAGAYLVEPTPQADARGFFARLFSAEEFAAAGLVATFVQSSVSFYARRGTVRGMHFSVAPHAETKLVRCTAGAIFDALVDLRPASPSYLNTIGVELSADDRRGLYIPVGVAHGFQALRDGAEVLYMIDKPYVAAAARGIRWNDPAAPIDWPEPITAISDRDAHFPDWPK